MRENACAPSAAWVLAWVGAFQRIERMLLPRLAVSTILLSTPPPAPTLLSMQALDDPQPDDAVARRAVLGLVAGGATVTVAGALGLANALGWDLIGDSTNRGVGTPLSREESLALQRGNIAEDACAVVVGQTLSQRCLELQEEERALWGVVTGTEMRAR